MSNKQVAASSFADLQDASVETADTIIANSSIKIQLREDNARVLNPMQMGAPDELVTLFASMAEISRDWT